MGFFSREGAETEVVVQAIPLFSVLNEDGSAMPATTPGAGGLARVAGGFGSGTIILEGEAASNNTKVGEAMFTWVVPHNFEKTAYAEASKSLKFRFKARVSTPANVGATLDIEVRRSDGEGGVSGSDICATSAIAINSATWADCEFTVTSTLVEPGEELTIMLQASVNDSGGASGAKAQIGLIQAEYNARM